MQLVEPDSVVAFVCFCRRFSSVSSVSGVTGQEILKVTLLSTFYGEM